MLTLGSWDKRTNIAYLGTQLCSASIESIAASEYTYIHAHMQPHTCARACIAQLIVRTHIHTHAYACTLHMHALAYMMSTPEQFTLPADRRCAILA